MRIYQMTATFGKLNHETLTLQPGLNILEAPNEWGKSTWCAFLVAMLYGVDTKERTKQGFLAVKDHYAPWSGQPMSGSMEIHWNGRNITLQRRSKGRIPMGEFSAFETDTGLPVPELTGENCGKLLLGVEREVFTRAGFIRLAEMPVTNDDALRARLNALVTTGDESDTGEKLAQKLKDLKNSCRHNKTGLLPKLEARRQELQDTLDSIDSLDLRHNEARQQLDEVKAYIAQLQNHQANLAYEGSLADSRRLQEAVLAREAAGNKLDALQAECAALPSQEEANAALGELAGLQKQWAQLQSRSQSLPESPIPPVTPAPFAGKTPVEALVQATEDRSTYEKLCKPSTPLLLCFGILAFSIGLGLSLILWYLLLPFAAAGIALIALHLKNSRALSQKRELLATKYGNSNPDSWVALAQQYQQNDAAYQQKKAEYETLAGDISRQQQAVAAQIDALTKGAPLSDCMARWSSAISVWDRLADARRDFAAASSYADTLSAVTKEVPPPPAPDTLTLTQEATARALAEAQYTQQQLTRQLGQYQGQITEKGQKEAVLRELEAVNARISRLEDVYSALQIGMDTLSRASKALQRRFAPRISQRAAELFSRMTGGRYTKLTLAEDLSLNVSAQEEDTLRSALWRSDGTADQLYLSLRLAVAEELTADAPLILDDALVRFDDHRLREALHILKEEAQEKQVILFTCQTRENQLI